MITLFLLSSIEIYVIAVIVAAAVIALCVRPSGRGHAREYLLAGILCAPENEEAEVVRDTAGLSVECLDNGDVLLTRFGLKGVTESGAVSLAVTVVGFDVTIEERIINGSAVDEPVDTALFTLDFLGRERYHVRYNSDPTSMAVAFTLSNRPGMNFVRELKINS